MCRCGCAGANQPSGAGPAPNVGLTFVPTIQTPTQQAMSTNATIRPKRDWLDYALLFLAFMAVVNLTKRTP